MHRPAEGNALWLWLSAGIGIAAILLYLHLREENQSGDDESGDGESSVPVPPGADSSPSSFPADEAAPHRQPRQSPPIDIPAWQSTAEPPAELLLGGIQPVFQVPEAPAFAAVPGSVYVPSPERPTGRINSCPARLEGMMELEEMRTIATVLLELRDQSITARGAEKFSASAEF